MKRLYILTICAMIVLGHIAYAGDVVLNTPPEWVLAQYYRNKVATLNVELRNIPDDSLVDSTSPLEDLTFNGIGSENFGTDNPWVVADQYIRIKYNCNYVSWGIKLITDNNTDPDVQPDIGGLEPRPIGIGPGEDEVPGTGDDTWGAGPDGVFGTNDDIWGAGPDEICGTADDTVKVSFGGLILKDQEEDNPTFRADLGWQIWQGWLALWYQGITFGIKPPAPQDGSDFDCGTDSIEDDWKSKWAYVIDKGNTGYQSEVITGYKVVEDEDGNKEIFAIYSYDVAIFGDGVSSALAQHPPNSNLDQYGEPKEKDGDGDVAVYIAGRFCSTDYWVDPDGVDFILPMGNYHAKLYVEMVFE